MQIEKYLEAKYLDSLNIVMKKLEILEAKNVKSKQIFVGLNQAWYKARIVEGFLPQYVLQEKD